MVNRGGTTQRLATALMGATLVLAAGGCSGASPSPTASGGSSQPSLTASPPTVAPVPGSIIGTATVATTGEPVAGVRIRGRSFPPPGLPDPPEAIAVTDARGAYRLSFPTWPGGNPHALFLTLELPPGFLLVAMTNTGGPSGPCELNAGAGSPAQGGSVGCRFDDLGDGPIDITLALGNAVEGRVTSGLTGAPLAGIQVSALKLNSILIDGNPASDAFEVAAVATTDATGRYSLTVPSSYVIYAPDAVPSSSYVIYAQEPGGSQQRFWSDDPTVFQATPLSVKRAIAGVNIALVPVTAMRGEVRSGPTQFADGVAGARVVAYLAGDAPCCRIGGVAITGGVAFAADSGFFLMFLPKGLYRIEFTPPPGSTYAAEWWNGATGFATATDVTLGSTEVQLEVELAPLSP